MKKFFTKISLMAVALLMGGVSSAWAETETFTIDLSKFDNALTYNSETKTASIALSTKNWSKLDLKEYFDQINGNITNIKISLTENIGANNTRMALGLFDYNKTKWATEGYQDVNNSVSVWGVMAGSNATRIYYNGTSTYTSGLTAGTDEVVEINMNFSTKKFTLKVNGTTKVNGQNFVDTNIDFIRWFALYSWSANTTTIKNMTMEVTYNATKHAVTFNETNSREYSLVVKDVQGTTIEPEVDGSYSLYEGGKYSYVATPTNILEYGVIAKSFTVGTEDVNIPLTLTAITLPEYSLPAKALYSKATVPSGTKQTTGISRTASNTTGVGGPMNNSWTWTIGKGFTWHALFDVYRADASASVNMKMYTNGAAESTSFQFDAEGVKYWTGKSTSYISNTALTPGKWYRVEFVSDLAGVLTASGNTFSVTITDIATNTQVATKSGIGFRNDNAQWFLPTNNQVTNTILANWYSYYIADEFTKTVGTTGFGTFSADLPVTVPAGVTVYETSQNGSTVEATATEATIIPANTPVVFKAAASSTVTFAAAYQAGTAITTCLTAAPAGKAGDGTFCGLQKNAMIFAKVMTGVSLAANSAYLPISVGGKEIKFVVVDDVTAADAVTEQAAKVAPVKYINAKGQIVIGNYNVAGQMIK